MCVRVDRLVDLLMVQQWNFSEMLNEGLHKCMFDRNRQVQRDQINIDN